MSWISGFEIRIFDEVELSPTMANDILEEIEVEQFCKALIHEIIDEYMRGKIEPGQALDRVSFDQKKLADCWFPIDHPAINSLKSPNRTRLFEIYIDFDLPEMEIYFATGGPSVLHLADPQFIKKAARILRNGLREANKDTKVYHYAFQNGTYYLLRDPDKLPVAPNGLVSTIGINNIIFATDTIAICFAIDKDAADGPLYILHKHGNPECVHEWAKSTRAAYRKAGMEDLARSITVIEGKFPVEEVNKCLDNTAYLKKFCQQYNLIEGNQLPDHL